VDSRHGLVMWNYHVIRYFSYWTVRARLLVELSYLFSSFEFLLYVFTISADSSLMISAVK
jgi:hypothetical protein